MGFRAHFLDKYYMFNWFKNQTPIFREEIDHAKAAAELRARIATLRSSLSFSTTDVSSLPTSNIQETPSQEIQSSIDEGKTKELDDIKAKLLGKKK